MYITVTLNILQKLHRLPLWSREITLGWPVGLLERPCFLSSAWAETLLYAETGFGFTDPSTGTSPRLEGLSNPPKHHRIPFW